MHAVCVCCGLTLVDFNYIHQDYFTGTGAIIWLPQGQWNNPEGGNPEVQTYNYNYAKYAIACAYFMEYIVGPNQWCNARGYISVHKQ